MQETLQTMGHVPYHSYPIIKGLVVLSHYLRFFYIPGGAGKAISLIAAQAQLISQLFQLLVEVFHWWKNYGFLHLVLLLLLLLLLLLPSQGSKNLVDMYSTFVSSQGIWDQQKTSM